MSVSMTQKKHGEHVQGCHRSENGHGKKISSRLLGKVREIYFESGEIDILKKSQGKWKKVNMADLIPWRCSQSIKIDIGNQLIQLISITDCY